MLSFSWLRWMDPLIDFPRDLYYAWRLSEGELLYERLANWYGPLAQLVQGACFRIFGTGLDTMIWSNIVLAAIGLALLYDLFLTLGNRLSAWLCTMFFLSAFAFGHYTVLGNYNFIAPYVAQSIYSFWGLVMLLWGLVRYLRSGKYGWLGGAGVGLAIVYLDKPEALLAAMGALGIFFPAQMMQAARTNPAVTNWREGWRWAGRAAGRMAVGFFALWLPILIYFIYRGGWSYAILATNFVPYSVVNSRFRSTLMSAHVQQGFFGFDKPWANFCHQALTGALLIVLLGLMAWASRKWTRTAKKGVEWWAMLFLVIAPAVSAAVIARVYAEGWAEIGSAFVFPVILAAGAAAAWSWRSAWQRRADLSRVLPNAIVGVAAALMMARMILNGRIFHFGFFMMPLALLWVVNLMAVEAAAPVVGARRRNTLLPWTFALLVLCGGVSLASVNLTIYSMKNFEMGTGRDHFYAFPANVSANGSMLKVMIIAFQEKTPKAKSLAVFPEGIAVNYFLRVPSSLKTLEYQPTAIAYAGPATLLDDLQKHPPEAVILFSRDMTEFGVKYFGAEEGSGRNLVLWLNDNYLLVGAAGETDKSVTGHNLDVLVPKATINSGGELPKGAQPGEKTTTP